MKLFSDMRFIKIKIFSLSLFVLFIVASCASYHSQLGRDSKKITLTNDKDTTKIAHRLFLIGDAGNADEENAKKVLSALKEQLSQSDKNATLLFLGDNIYPKGMPDEKDKAAYDIALEKIKLQLALSKDFKGKTIFIPGNHDWYSGINGLKRQEKIVNNYLNDKKAFLPANSCPIDDKKINDQLCLVIIDSQWFLEDWDKIPNINDDCSIKTREDFFEEFESILNKNKDKTVVVAIHHPLMSNGTHGGQFSLEKQLFPLEQKIPLPIIGSFVNFFRKTSGISPQDIQNKQYQILVKRLKTLLQNQDNVVLVSGHDHNLQYIENENIKQIISGAGSKSEAARAINPNDFSYGKNGFATLTSYTNGKTTVKYFGIENNKTTVLFEKTIIEPKKETISNYPNSFAATTKASIYSPEMTSKSIFHNFLLGKHYREYYSQLIEVPIASLNSLFGGVTPLRAGGGHQSKSLRLVNADGKEYVMRALKKSASRFLQSVAFKDQYVENEFENTYAENFLYDFYTTSHPYAPLAVGNMADKIGVFHSNPALYYIPKQKVLGEFNADFGDELYLVEERPTDSQKELLNFGKSEAIIGTDELLENLQKDEKYAVDENEYIKARIFDMLIGDWDRHYDQWRWAEYKIGNKTIYKPIPRDRDQAFSKYDGALLSILMNIPALRHMQSFKNNIDNVKWFNREAYPLDVAFLKNATEKDWIAQAKYIQENLSDIAIDNAFDNLPKEVQDETIASIKQKLKLRKAELTNYASQYNKVLQKTVIVVGTNKKDQFSIKPLSKNKVEITVSRIKKKGKELVYSKTFDSHTTKNIWIYGLDDEDVFDLQGAQKSAIKIKLIGGQNNDSYVIANGKNITILDFKSKKNTFETDSRTKTILTDDYETNYYNYQKPKYNAFSGLPTIGFNPDDGIKLGIIANYTINHFKQNPYTLKHTLKANYYFATDGFELDYHLDVPKIIGKWNFGFDSQFTSPNFAINYFGYGNNTANVDEINGMDYNRVHIRMLKFAPKIEKIGRLGSRINFQLAYENFDVENTAGRFISIPNIVNPEIFNHQQFAGATVEYAYENYDSASLPTMGMGFLIAANWKMNLEDSKQNFPTLESKINFNHKIDHQGKIVFATLLKGKMILNNNFEFYQAAALGGDYDLRGFRNQRFIGNQSFFQSSDLRFSIGKIKNSIIPMSYGFFGGYDYGRVWLDGETSNKWHQSAGGGLWLNGINTVTARLSYFKSADDEARISFGIGFGF
ncbi:metallophosphoesterase [Flavobacterium sufflavum]|uniref:Metallophosphoesterase n=1 Tax=Flavobacterium sufflavum TaxID=1921138 RepID=A0A437KXP5_9FLAO|nr:metallophosphoesterase [Flavobacterium sufflavum]RVT77388.1 metallophosphoesterase [Flavobacterium sufflavum]